MNDEQKNEIKKAIRFGHSVEEIAEIEGITPEQVKAISDELVKEESPSE